jgi:hypothetical protein
MTFEHTDQAGQLYRPTKFGDAYRTVDPQRVSKAMDSYSEANSEDVLLDHLRRGFYLWMTSAVGDAKLVPPSAIIAKF